ncbi:MAG: molybdenum cofactor guanylyltransferase [Planctomycetaceae bacterium]|nr:molybdenum cofactor guanylyltransferase [Planctomycetaceae bacterium]
MKSEIKTGGLVLCGGKSTRMGLAKATLPFGPELMLQRVVRLVAQEVSPIAVVAAPGQELPPLPAEVIVARDKREGRGPLEGLLAGLTALAPHCDAAYATSCDVPLLSPAFVREMISRLGGHEIAVPAHGQFHHPLAAVYRTSIAAMIAQLLAADQLRPVYLFDRAATCRVPVSELAAVDPGLSTLKNLNHPGDYFAALAEEGLAADPAVARALAASRSET